METKLNSNSPLNYRQKEWEGDQQEMAGEVKLFENYYVTMTTNANDITCSDLISKIFPDEYKEICKGTEIIYHKGELNLACYFYKKVP